MVKSKGNFIFLIISYAFLILLAILVFFPFICAFTTSFKGTREVLVSGKILPEKWQFDAFITAWKNADFARYTWNSIWYSALTVIISVLTSSMNGFAFARGQFRGKKTIFALFTSMMFIVLGTSTMYPTLQILKLLHLNKSHWGLIFQSFFALHVSSMFLVRGFVNSLPASLDEAAEIDGCGFIKTFFLIYLPIMKPIIATIAIFSFSGEWNNYLMPMVVTLNNPSQRPLAVGLTALKSTADAAANWNVIMAGAMISAIPMIIVFLIFNKYFITGLTSGAVKG